MELWATTDTEQMVTLRVRGRLAYSKSSVHTKFPSPSLFSFTSFTSGCSGTVMVSNQIPDCLSMMRNGWAGRIHLPPNLDFPGVIKIVRDAPGATRWWAKGLVDLSTPKQRNVFWPNIFIRASYIIIHNKEYKNGNRYRAMNAISVYGDIYNPVLQVAM